MRAAVISDFHLFSSWSARLKKPIWAGKAEVLLRRFTHRAKREGVELVLIPGDIIHAGGREEIAKAIALLEAIDIKAVVTIGNHDLCEKGNDRVWKENLYRWPDAKLGDCLHQAPNFDVLALNNHWLTSSGPGMHFRWGDYFGPWLIDEQLEYARQELRRRPDLPAVLLIHAPWNWPDLRTSYAAAYKKRLGRLIDENPSIRLVVCGHIHDLRISDPMTHGAHEISTPSLFEAPFYWWLIEIGDSGEIRIETQHLLKDEDPIVVKANLADQQLLRPEHITKTFR